MYTTQAKIGNVIMVHGCRPAVGTSTLAAMTASLLSLKDEKTLLISTDADAPFDGVSLLASDANESHMDELVMLETSNGLNQDNMQDYITMLTGNLGYLRTSSQLKSLSSGAIHSLQHVIDLALYSYRYVVVDIGFVNTIGYATLLKSADVILHTLGQDPKSIAKAKDTYSQNEFGENAFVVPIVMGYDETIAADAKHMAKRLGTDDVYVLSHDPDVYKAVVDRNVATFVQKGMKKKGNLLGGLFGKRKTEETDTTFVEDLNEIITQSLAALNEEANVDGSKH